ncbi:uncharacterized protein LOC120935601 [Rana temporaria]|uniref:uncharacterized protein LOC120935601 n=1 Tax=Rana temporaria TaxID=8407 RepID=UPI001AAD98EC|nr:uncharacterized protein LOC120935601 [Rana temporaria]
MASTLAGDTPLLVPVERFSKLKSYFITCISIYLLIDVSILPTCSPRPHFLRHLLAFVFAVEEINRRSDILPNITLGYMIYDACMLEHKAIQSVLSILSGMEEAVPKYSCNQKNRVMAFIGHFTSSSSLAIARVTEIYRYPQVRLLTCHSMIPTLDMNPTYTDYCQCGCFYVDKTKRPFLKRIKDHVNPLYKSLMTTAPNRHVGCLHDFDINSINFAALEHVPLHVRGGGIDQTLLQLETKWIHVLDAVKFPGDTSTSLTHLMELVHTFGTFSGFKINWDKSTLLPLDPLLGPLPQIADQIKIVDKFKYLGIMVHPNLDQYIKLNVEPILKKFQEKTTSWIKLPLSVVGRCNLIKMIWNPQLLYVLHNAPIWIPAQVFKKCNTIYRALIWRKLIPRIKLETLQERRDLGGLAAPNPFLYFIAAQLQHLAGWLCPGSLDPTRNMVRAQVTGDNLVECIEAGELGAIDQYPTLILIDKIWNKTKHLQYSIWDTLAGHMSPTLPPCFHLPPFLCMESGCALGAGLITCVIRVTVLPELELLHVILAAFTDNQYVIYKSFVYLYAVLQVSYGAMDPIFNDKLRFPSFYRTVPDEKSQYRAIVLLLKHFGWNWVGIVTTYDETSQRLSTELHNVIIQSGLCVEFNTIVSVFEKPEVFEKKLYEIEKSKCNVILFFGENDYLTGILMLKNYSKGKVVITSPIVTVKLSVSDIVNGSLHIALHKGNIPKFKDYLLSAGPRKYLNGKFKYNVLRSYKDENNYLSWRYSPDQVETIIQEDPALYDVNNFRYTFSVYSAVYAVAYALHDLYLYKSQVRSTSLATNQLIKPWELNRFLKKKNVITPGGDPIYFDNKGKSPARYELLNYIVFPNQTVEAKQVGYFSESEGGCQFLINDSAIHWDPIFLQGPLECTGKYLDGLLKEMVNNLPSFVQDTQHVLGKLQDLSAEPIPPSTLLVSIDVESLYTSIPHEIGITAVQTFLDEAYPLAGPQNEFIAEMLEFALNNNNFQFMGTYYRQIRDSEGLATSRDFDGPLTRGSREDPGLLDLCSKLTEWPPVGLECEPEHKTPRSVCSKSCLPGYRKVPQEGRQRCCYDCVPCAKDEISNQTDMKNCLKCPEELWPNERRDTCIPKEIDYLSYDDTLGVFIRIIALLFCFASIVVLFCFIKHRSTVIVKANNRTLCFTLLLSLALSFLCPLLFIGRPTKISCLLQQVAFGNIFTIAVSSVLARAVTVILAFKATKPHMTLGRWLGKHFSMSLLAICSSGEIVISVFWLIFSPPFPDYDTQVEEGKMILQCNEGSITAFYIVIGYMGCLAVFSFIVAFLARTLPDMFNEAQYITFSMLVFCSVWISFVPAYLSTKGKYMVAVEIFAILSSSAGLLGCIFIPKCYIILIRPELNVKPSLVTESKINYKL